ncbi:MAG: non-heme iron oxygenase ferredoxin subunit [Sphingomonadales bacterium]
MAERTVARVSDIPEDEGLCVAVDGVKVALFRVGGAVYAIADTCSHAEASLAEGFLEGTMIECPLHQACFDIRTGKVLSDPATEDVASYPARIDGDSVIVDL